MTDNVLLKMEHITKRFSGVTAVNDMNFCVRRGEIHALVGENGAGKSTLMKILVGLYKADEGTIEFDGKPLDTSSIQKVLTQGISMIYQELNPINDMTVAENIYCNKEPAVRGLPFAVDYRQMHREADKLLDTMGIHSIRAKTRVRHLSQAQKQLLEIAKSIANQSKLIIMDEPTSSLTEAECQLLFKIVFQLRDQGVSFVFISHKLDEILGVCDYVTVMRDANFIGENKASELTENDLIRMMIGRELNDIYPKQEVPIGEKTLEVKQLSCSGVFEDVSFSAHAGEILGFAGLMGSGRTEVMETIFGVRKASGGEILIDGRPASIRRPADAVRNKMAFLTEDRRTTGCFLEDSVLNNMMILSWDKVGNGLYISPGKGRTLCQQMIEEFSIKVAGVKQPINQLSGGNQQKSLFARWLQTDPKIFILDEPTRGIDVGSKHEIYMKITELARQGKTIILVSSELPEVLGMSDRIVVMHEGRISGILDRKDADQDIIMQHAAGMVTAREV